MIFGQEKNFRANFNCDLSVKVLFPLLIFRFLLLPCPQDVPGLHQGKAQQVLALPLVGVLEGGIAQAQRSLLAPDVGKGLAPRPFYQIAEGLIGGGGGACI